MIFKGYDSNHNQVLQIQNCNLRHAFNFNSLCGMIYYNVPFMLKRVHLLTTLPRVHRARCHDAMHIVQPTMEEDDNLR